MPESEVTPASGEELLSLLALRDAAAPVLDQIGRVVPGVADPKLMPLRVQLAKLCQKVKELGVNAVCTGLGIGDDRFYEALEASLAKLQAIEDMYAQLPSLYITRWIKRANLKKVLHDPDILDTVAHLEKPDWMDGWSTFELQDYKDSKEIDKDTAIAVLTTDRVHVQAAILRGLMHPVFDEAFLLKLLEGEDGLNTSHCSKSVAMP